MQKKYINGKLAIDSENYLKKWFTFVEIIVATSISVTIMTFIFIFLIDTTDNIWDSKRNVSTLSAFYDFSNKLYNYRSIYLTWWILIDNPTSTWSDVFLMQDYDWQNGILVWPVKIWDSQLYLDNTLYENKWIWFRALSSIELVAITTDSWAIYDLKFQEDQIFSDINIHDFSLTEYNSWTIYELRLLVETDFQITFVPQLLSEISKETQKVFIINF